MPPPTKTLDRWLIPLVEGADSASVQAQEERLARRKAEAARLGIPLEALPRRGGQPSNKMRWQALLREELHADRPLPAHVQADPPSGWRAGVSLEQAFLTEESIIMDAKRGCEDVSVAIFGSSCLHARASKRDRPP